MPLLNSNTDNYKCPADPKTGSMVGRSVTYMIYCDATLPIGKRKYS